MAEMKEMKSTAQEETNKENEIEEEINEEENNEISEQDTVDENLQKLKKKEQECEEYLDLLKRTKAEFDNYRKRTLKEREGVYDDGFIDGIKQILPVIDNLERAVAYNTSENENLLQGVQMVLKLFSDTLVKNEIEEIPAEGMKFDPHYHNAVMHIEDPQYEDNVIVEVLQKGYKYKEKIIRYSMVKVAN